MSVQTSKSKSENKQQKLARRAMIYERRMADLTHTHGTRPSMAKIHSFCLLDI